MLEIRLQAFDERIWRGWKVVLCIEKRERLGHAVSLNGQ